VILGASWRHSAPGLYTHWSTFGLCDLATVLRGVAGGSCISAGRHLAVQFEGFSRSVFIIDAVLLAGAIMGSRLSFGSLRASPGQCAARRDLRRWCAWPVAGARLLANATWKLELVAFVDDVTKRSENHGRAGRDRSTIWRMSWARSPLKVLLSSLSINGSNEVKVRDSAPSGRFPSDVYTWKYGEPWRPSWTLGRHRQLQRRRPLAPPASLHADLEDQDWNVVVVDSASHDGSAQQRRICRRGSPSSGTRSIAVRRRRQPGRPHRTRPFSGSSTRIVESSEGRSALRAGARRASRRRHCRAAAAQRGWHDQESARGDPTASTGLFGRHGLLTRVLPRSKAVRRNLRATM
jgi:hypothetical protein